jgi:hypothetical protein
MTTSNNTTMDRNSVVNQDIKGKFVAREVYCNVNSLVEYIIKQGFEDSNAPFTLDDVENYYSYPEWSKKVLGEDLYFKGGSEAMKNSFLENFDRLIEESEDLHVNEEISEATHERNVQLVEEAREEFEEATEESEPQEIYEWWAVSSYLFDKLKANGACVVDAGSCYVWGRTTSGQAILLDGVISDICEGMEILEGQPNDWSKK